MKNKPIQSKFILAHRGNQMEFPSEQSMKFYVEEFLSHFPETDTTDLEMYRADIYALPVNKVQEGGEK